MNKYNIILAHTEHSPFNLNDKLHLLTDDLKYYYVECFDRDNMDDYALYGINYIDLIIDNTQNINLNLAPKEILDKLIELREDKFKNLEM